MEAIKRAEFRLKGESSDIVEQLLNAKDEWTNIQEIIKLTFIAVFNSIKEIERVLPHKANKADCVDYISQGQYRSFEEQCLEKISKLAIEIDSKPTLDELDTLEQEMVSKEDLEIILRDPKFKPQILESPINYDLSDDLNELKKELDQMNKTIHT